MSESGEPQPLDPRVAELLSADLDGAVTAEEQEIARQWVEGSATARAERDSLAGVKAALASLPDVEPPAGFFEAMLAQGAPRRASVVPLRRRLAIGAAAAVAAAAAWVVIAGGTETITPPVDDVEAALGGHDADDSVDLARFDGGRVALRQQDGDVAWSELPEGTRGIEDGADTWIDLTSGPGVARVVVARADALVTLVSEDLDAEALIDVGVERLPDDGNGLLDRIRRAAERLLDAFGG